MREPKGPASWDAPKLPDGPCSMLCTPPRRTSTMRWSARWPLVLTSALRLPATCREHTAGAAGCMMAVKGTLHHPSVQ